MAVLAGPAQWLRQRQPRHRSGPRRRHARCMVRRPTGRAGRPQCRGCQRGLVARVWRPGAVATGGPGAPVQHQRGGSSGGRSTARVAAKAPATTFRPGWTPAGKSTSSARGAAPWTRRGHGARQRGQPGRRAGVGGRREWPGLHRLRSGQARLAIALDNLASQQQTLQITEWRAQAGLLSALEGAAGARRQRPDRSPVAGAADQHDAVCPGAGRADRPGPGGPGSLLATPAPVPQPGRPGAEPAGRHLAPAPRRACRRSSRCWPRTGRVAQADAARYPSFTLGGSLGLRRSRWAAWAAARSSARCWPASTGRCGTAAPPAPRCRPSRRRWTRRGGHTAARARRLEGRGRRAGGLRGDRERVLNGCSRPPRRQQRRHAGATSATQRPGRLPDRARHPAQPAGGAGQPGQRQRRSAPTTCACSRPWAVAGRRFEDNTGARHRPEPRP
jgi:hypothetical protein